MSSLPPPVVAPASDGPRAGPAGEAAWPSTGFGALAPEAGRTRAAGGGDRAAAVFDVCHVGVVLRAVLFVHGVLAIGTAFAARGFGDWGFQFAVASGVALPALLCWLLSACVAQRALGRLPVTAQAVAATGWGAVCGAVAWQLWGWLQWSEAGPSDGLHAVAVACAGAAFAAVFFAWLRQRARLEQPAASAARLTELQARIRPHFLFNTLNTAIALVRTDPAQAEAVLEDLAELFRAALGDGAAGAVATLGDEVELARRYLAIEQLRFGDRLRVQWEIDAAAQGARLPPLLLQPLVENAVKHGVEPALHGGVLRVRTRVRHGQVEILVANSVPDAASVPGHGIALRNVHERLRLMHDVASSFRAGRDGDVYRVQIVVPL